MKNISNIRDAKTCMWHENGICTMGKTPEKDKKFYWMCVSHVSKYTCSMYKPDFTKLMEGALNENVINY